MISLSDEQLKSVMTAASALAPERRDMFLQRCAAVLRLKARFDDSRRRGDLQACPARSHPVAGCLDFTSAFDCIADVVTSADGFVLVENDPTET
jgi:hypothetical protein